MRRLLPTLFLLGLILKTAPLYAFGMSPLFKAVEGPARYQPTLRGYGFLGEAGSEAEMLTTLKGLTGNSCPSSQEGKKVLRDEQLRLSFLLLRMSTLRAPWDSPCASEGLIQDFQNFDQQLKGKGFFYTLGLKNEGAESGLTLGLRHKIYSGQKETWATADGAFKNLAHKALVLKEQTSVEGMLKAQLTLDFLEQRLSPMNSARDCFKKDGVLEQNACIDNWNTYHDLLQSFFLLTPEVQKKTRELLKSLLRKNEVGEYQNFLKRYPQLFSLAEVTRKLESQIKRALKKGNNDLFNSFLRELELKKRELSLRLSRKACEGEFAPIVKLQSVREHGAPACLLNGENFKAQCFGVSRKDKTISVEAPFYHQGFRAQRNLRIKNQNEKSHIEVKLRFQVDQDVDLVEAKEKLSEWQSLAHDFYNKSAQDLQKPVSFSFSFEIDDEHPEAIHLRQCWNALRGSSVCHGANQPDSKNFTLDMRDDVILEEIAHNMGLFDEYDSYYYIFNALGARDSFMVAPKDFKMKAHHIEQMLLPLRVCALE